MQNFFSFAFKFCWLCFAGGVGSRGQSEVAALTIRTNSKHHQQQQVSNRIGSIQLEQWQGEFYDSMILSFYFNRSLLIKTPNAESLLFGAYTYMNFGKVNSSPLAKAMTGLQHQVGEVKEKQLGRWVLAIAGLLAAGLFGLP